MTSMYHFWLSVYMYALECARDNFPTHYSSRIDGALLPFDPEI